MTATIALLPAIVIAVCALASYMLRKFTPDVHFFHTGIGAFALALVSGVLSTASAAIQAHGLSTASLVPALLGFTLSLVGSANPSMRITDSLKVLVLIFVFGTACASCPPSVQQLGVDLGACAAGVVPGVLTGLVQQTVGSLLGTPGQPSWASYSTGQLLSQGISAATCAVAAAVHDLAAKVPKTGQADPAYVDAIMLGVDWLDQHGVGVSLPDHVQAHVAARRARKSMLQLGPPVALPSDHIKHNAPQDAPPLTCVMVDADGVLTCMKTDR